MAQYHNIISTLYKSLYFEGWNLTPEANAAGAAFTPKLNAFGNNLTLWDLTVQDVQVGRERHVYTRVTCTHVSHIHTCHVYTRVTTHVSCAGGGRLPGQWRLQ